MSDPLLPTYGAPSLHIVGASKRRVLGDDGRWYLDAIGGIAVSALGHAHPAILSAVHRQVDAVLHASNLYRVPVQTRLARRLLDLLGGVGTFLCNSGTEANEAAVKFVRKHHWRLAGSPDGAPSPRTEIVVAEHAFHGRSLMALAMTPRPAYQAGFGPLPGPVRVVPVERLAEAVNDATAAVFVEPVQGEGGCRPVPRDVLVRTRAACDEHGALLVYDEIQCGLGRTGVVRHTPRPDLLTLAKALGGGLPLGALVVINPELGDTFGPGDHGSTFGGNPVACAAGEAFLRVLDEEDLPGRVTDLGAHLRAGLEGLGLTVRGRGLMLAAQVDQPAGPVVAAMRKQGVLVCAAGATAVRFLPAFTSTTAELDEMVAALGAALAELAA